MSKTFYSFSAGSLIMLIAQFTYSLIKRSITFCYSANFYRKYGSAFIGVVTNKHP